MFKKSFNSLMLILVSAFGIFTPVLMYEIALRTVPIAKSYFNNDIYKTNFSDLPIFATLPSGLIVFVPALVYYIIDRLNRKKETKNPALVYGMRLALAVVLIANGIFWFYLLASNLISPSDNHLMLLPFMSFFGLYAIWQLGTISFGVVFMITRYFEKNRGISGSTKYSGMTILMLWFWWKVLASFFVSHHLLDVFISHNSGSLMQSIFIAGTSLLAFYGVLKRKTWAWRYVIGYAIFIFIFELASILYSFSGKTLAVHVMSMLTVNFTVNAGITCFVIFYIYRNKPYFDK